MIIFLKTPAQASAWCIQQRTAGKSIGFIPTMGALHAGHLSLVERSVSQNDVTCASIFVNPLQFNNAADLEKYPTAINTDLEMLQKVDCDMVFTGTLDNFFPESKHITTVKSDNTRPMIEGLEADYRPGHLQGVKAIVERLFATVGNCRAYFGEKDFQQTLLVKRIAACQGNVRVVVCPTVREPTGLAMSSRNALLTEAARNLAPQLYRTLLTANDAWNAGERNAARLEQLMKNSIQGPGIELEYAAIRDPNRWTADTPEWPLENAQALIAAYLGAVRLIDNIRLG